MSNDNAKGPGSLPTVFEVERDCEGQLAIGYTGLNEEAAREILAAKGDGWRLVSYPLGDKAQWTLLAGPEPASNEWPYKVS